jgi:hypothetical protein
MVDHWRWHAGTRVPRGARLTAIIGLLLSCLLFAALPAIASASTPEVAGEWTVSLKYSGGTAIGIAMVTQEANSKGEFSSNMTIDGSVPGTFSGTLEGATATVETTSQAEGPLPAGKFNSAKGAMTVESTANSLALSGSGIFEIGGEKYAATVVATRVRTLKQIEEQEAKEKLEKEEKEARANVRGEWAITLEYGPEKIVGTAIISAEGNSKNEFLSSSAIANGAAAGSFSGKLEGDEATVKITTEASGPYPATEFTGSKITVASASDPASMTGAGKLTAGGAVLEGTQLTATRIKTYQEVVERETAEREAKEKAELEAKEKAEQEAKAKAEQEAKEKAEQEATAKAAQEAKAKAEQEAKVKAEQEAKAKAEREAKEKEALKAPAPAALVSAEPTAKTLTLASSGALALGLANHNAYAIQGHLTLSARKGKKATLSFGSASFTIAADGSETVKVKLSSAARAYLTHHKTLSLALVISTSASDMHSAKTYTITLHAAKATSGKH